MLNSGSGGGSEDLLGQVFGRGDAQGSGSKQRREGSSRQLVDQHRIGLDLRWAEGDGDDDGGPLQSPHQVAEPLE